MTLEKAEGRAALYPAALPLYRSLAGARAGGKGHRRPSTYAPTITRPSIARGYVLRDKRKLSPTELGRMVTSMMREYFKEIVDIAFTSEMEEELDRVEEDALPGRRSSGPSTAPFTRPWRWRRRPSKRWRSRTRSRTCPATNAGP